MRTLVLAATLVAAAHVSLAQTKALRFGAVVEGTGRVVANGVIIVDGDKITRVAGPRDPLPAGATVIDLTRYTAIPGMIDAHTHMTYAWDPASGTDPWRQPQRAPAEVSRLQRLNALHTLETGVTTVRDLGASNYVDVAMRDSINAGAYPGPRMFVAGGYITTPGGGGEIDALAPDIPLPETFRIGEVHNASEARDRARYLLDHGADFIKLIATGAVLALGSEPGALELSPEEMKAACDEAKLRGSYCIAHAHGAEGIKAAIRAGVRTIEHASYLDAEGIALAKANGVWLDMDVYNGDYINDVGTRQGWPAEYLRKNIETTDVQRRGFAAAVKAGAKMTFGTDAGVYPYGLGARQFAYMVRYGMTPMQAIQSATSEAARALRMDGKVGSLAPGAYGDFVAAKGDPLSDIRVLERVDGVIKEGRLIR